MGTLNQLCDVGLGITRGIFILFYFISDIECPSFNITDIPESRLSHGYKIGTEANFTCPSGFELIGESKLTCLSNGMNREIDHSLILI